MVVNRYSIFIADIEPKGFNVVSADGILTSKVVQQVERVIHDEEYRNAMVDQNFELAKAFFSYSVARRKLRALICNITGADDL